MVGVSGARRTAARPLLGVPAHWRRESAGPPFSRLERRRELELQAGFMREAAAADIAGAERREARARAQARAHRPRRPRVRRRAASNGPRPGSRFGIRGCGRRRHRSGRLRRGELGASGRRNAGEGAFSTWVVKQAAMARPRRSNAAARRS